MKRSIALVLSLLLVVTAFAAVQAAGSWEAKVDASVLRAASQGTTDFIVYMAPKADLSAPSRMPTKAEKGTAVFNALTAEARITQAGVISVLENADASYRSFWITNAIHTHGDAALIETLASRPDVANIYATGKGQLDEPVTRGPASISAPSSTNLVEAVGPSVDYVNANDAWSLGYRGQGAVVASADTGVRWTHNAIKRQYRGFNETTGTAVHDYNWHDAFSGANADCVGNATAPCDDHDHGTHTVGTMVGDDGGVNQIGMAPDAEWIACRNMNQGFGVVPSYLDCMEWFIAPTDSTGANPDPTKAPDVVNNSWGCVEVCAGPILKDVIDASRAAGIFYAVSAGNDNQFFLGLTMACNTINFPLAIYKSAFTVGALDANGAGVPSDGIADYSSLGPVDTNPAEGVSYRKPDITAPGTNVRSSVHGSDSSYAAFSGTSMAGPHVAGLVALIISANPALRGHVDTIEDIIEQTAKPLTSNRGCGLDSNSQVPNNEFGWGRINALAAVQLAVLTGAPVNEPANVGGEPLDPAHNLALPCEAVSTVGALPRSAKNLLHVANVCGIVGTDIEFQSRRDSTGAVHDYAFVGTMGAGTRIFDVTDPHLPRFVGGYVDPGWQNDVQVFGDTLIMAFDPVGAAVHTSDCLRQKGTGTNGQVRGGVDFVQLTFDPALAALKAPLTFQTSRKGCYLTELGGGAHTITIHPSGEWLSLNTSVSGIEVVDLRNDAFTFVRKIPSAVAASAHDISFSRDGNTMYSAGVGSTRVIDVSDIFNRNPTLIANIANTPPADQADGHQIAISHQSDTTADGRLLVITDEKGGGLSHTACITSPTGTIGGANFYALTELAENPAKSAGASVATPRKVGTWIYPRAVAGVDPLDDVMAGFGRPEPSCTIHVFRLGGNGGQSPASAGQGNDGYDGVSRLPTNELVSAHYGAGVWHVDVMSAPGPDDDSRTTWGRTLGWNVMPGADTWSAKEYKGYIYAGDMARGFDIYTFGTCAGVECVDALPDATPAPTGTVAPTPTSNPTPTATPTDPSGCTADHVYFLGVVNDGNEPGEPRVDFQADVSNFEFFLSKLRQTYCIPDSQAQMLAFTNGWVDAQGNPMSPYPEASESNVKREIARLGAAANQHSDSVFFFFLSSHGIAYANAVSECPVDRVAGSMSGLKSGDGESGDFYDCELGSALNTSFAPTTRMFVDVDCSLCGGFSDSLTAVSGTLPDGSLPASAGVVAPNRIVVTGCAITTECFGSEVPEDGGVSYHHMREVLEGGIPACDGWTAPGFPTIEGFDLPVQGPPLREFDGECTASEWFFAAVNSAYVSLDVIAIQQQFRIKYRMPTLADDLLILGSNGPAPTPTATIAPTPTPTLAPTPTPTIAPRPDLSVSAMSASAQKAKAGDKIVINATIANTGNGASVASRTEFRLADGTLLGAVDAPSISAGGSASVSVTWDTRGANGDYVITATADVNNLNAETNEANNTANLSVTIRGNKVQNQSYEQPNSSGTAPEGWQGQSTGAGSTSYNQNSSNSSDGSDSVSITGNGKSALLYGAPTWTSSAFTVTPGELLTVAVDVKSVGLSSAPSLSLAYLGSAGQLLNTVKVLTAPLTTTGFSTLSTQVSVPLNVTSVKLVLSGFAATDTSTAGVVTFDNVGAWGE